MLHVGLQGLALEHSAWRQCSMLSGGTHACLAVMDKYLHNPPPLVLQGGGGTKMLVDSFVHT